MTEIEKNKCFLNTAFDKLIEEGGLNKIRINIESELKKFLVHLKTKLKDEQKIFDNMESRIKDKMSFEEKIERKDYINSWHISENIQLNKKLICETFQDLIGFRINCFFLQDEEIIYEELRKYNTETTWDVSLDFSEGTKQENGHKIFKVSGKYTSENMTYCFELQIKSIVHNIWGEVEHKTIYKNQIYEADLDTKKKFTEEIFNILSASDKQLLTIFTKKITQKQLIQALFFQMTYDEINGDLKHKILSKYYSAFFEIFECEALVTKYVAHKLNEGEIGFAKQDIRIDGNNEKNENIKKQLDMYSIKCLFYIANIIYQMENVDDFSIYLIRTIREKMQISMGSFSTFAPAKVQNDVFDEDIEESEENEEEKILTYLENKNLIRRK